MQTTTKLPVLFTSGSRRCLHLLSTQGCSSFVKYLNVLLSNLRYMAANKQTDIQTRLCNALPLVCEVLIQAYDGLRMSSKWVGSQKQQSFCLRREERRICFLSTQLPRSHPPSAKAFAPFPHTTFLFLLLPPLLLLLLPLSYRISFFSFSKPL